MSSFWITKFASGGNFEKKPEMSRISGSEWTTEKTFFYMWKKTHNGSNYLEMNQISSRSADYITISHFCPYRLLYIIIFWLVTLWLHFFRPYFLMQQKSCLYSKCYKIYLNAVQPRNPKIHNSVYIGHQGMTVKRQRATKFRGKTGKFMCPLFSTFCRWDVLFFSRPHMVALM